MSAVNDKDFSVEWCDIYLFSLHVINSLDSIHLRIFAEHRHTAPTSVASIYTGITAHASRMHIYARRRTQSLDGNMKRFLFQRIQYSVYFFF